MKRLTELYIDSKAAGWFTELGSSLKKTAAEVGIIATLLGRRSLASGHYRNPSRLDEAWKKIQELRSEAGFTPKPPGFGEGLAGAIQEGRARDRDREAQIMPRSLDEAEATRRGISLEAGGKSLLRGFACQGAKVRHAG